MAACSEPVFTVTGRVLFVTETPSLPALAKMLRAREAALTSIVSSPPPHWRVACSSPVKVTNLPVVVSPKRNCVTELNV